MEFPQAPGIKPRLKNCELVLAVQQKGSPEDVYLYRQSGFSLAGGLGSLKQNAENIYAQSTKNNPEDHCLDVFSIRGRSEGRKPVWVVVLAKAVSKNRVRLSIIIEAPGSMTPERFEDGHQLEVPGYQVLNFERLARLLLGTEEEDAI